MNKSRYHRPLISLLAAISLASISLVAVLLSAVLPTAAALTRCVARVSHQSGTGTRPTRSRMVASDSSYVGT